MGGFIDTVNNINASIFVYNDMIFVGEIISNWYGKGGRWINLGIPIYVEIDRNPENGPEIKN